MTKVTIDLKAATEHLRDGGRDDIDFMLRGLRGNPGNGMWGRRLAEQIEAQLPKPKPEEPRKLGAVVDAHGYLWVRISNGEYSPGDGRHWRRAGTAHVGGAPLRRYSEIDVSEVLHEGVSA